MSAEIEIQIWESELAEAYAKYSEAEQYGDYGSMHWYQEKINWAKHKIERLEQAS